MKLYKLEACLIEIQVSIDYEITILGIQLHVSPYACVEVQSLISYYTNGNPPVYIGDPHTECSRSYYHPVMFVFALLIPFMSTASETSSCRIFFLFCIQQNF